MKKIIALLLFVSPIIAMEQSELDIQIELLGLKKVKLVLYRQELKLKEQNTHIRRLEFLAKHGNAFLQHNPELNLLHQTGMSICTTSLIFKDLEELSNKKADRIISAMNKIKEALAKERGVPVSDVEQEEEIEDDFSFDLMKEAEQIADAYIQQKKDLS